MALSAKLQLRQSQSLVMTPQLLQSIRLLQFSRSELQSFVETEMERNPVIAVEISAGSDPGAPEPISPPPEAPPLRELSGARDDSAALERGFEGFSDEAGSGEPSPASQRRDAPIGGGAASGSGAAFDIEDLADRRVSLTDHAMIEARDCLGGPADLPIASSIVERLDEAGYARIDCAAVDEALGLPAGRTAAVLAMLQDSAEPAGLFARDLGECLAIQLRRRGRFDPVIATVIDNLDLLARRDFATLRRLTGEDEAGLLDILSEIRRLDPRPGLAFGREGLEPVVPDVIVTEAGEGGWQVDLNPEALPRLIVDNDYAARILSGARKEEERAFVAQCQQSANWLVRSLDQRARTIVKVASEIVRRQDGFLARGVSALRPMTLMSVADAVGMHESTISRVTANKFMATPRGTFEMRFFFTVAIASVSGGEAHSAESVKHRIRAMVDAETPGKVLSDDDIAATLKSEGVDLARRTVAKYREALGIASSIQRRREMNARRMAS